MKQITDYLPCPFCGCQQVREIDAWIDTDKGEEEAVLIECMMCDAQARAEMWNERRTPEQSWQRQLMDQADSDEPELQL